MIRMQFGSLAVVLFVGLWAVSVGFAVPGPQEGKSMEPFVKWAVNEDFDANAPHDPLVVGDKVVVGTEKGELRAYRCEDGEPVWTYPHGKRIYQHPCSDGERIYFSSETGLIAVAAADGTKVWSFDLASCDGPVLVLNEKGMVYVGGHDGILYALDAKTGEQRWTCDFITDAPPDPPHFSGTDARMTGTRARPSALASDGETLFLSVFDQCRVVAVDATSGEQRWSFQTRGWVYGAAVATGTHVFFGSQDKSFYCLDKQTGEQNWKYDTKGRIESGGAVDEMSVYFGSCDGGVYSLTQSDGEENWRFATDPQADGRPSPIYSVPLLREGSVCIAAGEGQTYAIDQVAGTLKWKIRPSEGAELFCSPATDGTHIFVVTRPPLNASGGASLVSIGLK